MLQHYVNNIPLGQCYIVNNGITRMHVCRHHLGDRSFQLWFTGDDMLVGTYQEFKLKRDAVRVGRLLSEKFDLPLIVN